MNASSSRENSPAIHAIVPAAGAGRRLAPESEVPKQYRTVLGHPLLEWTVNHLVTHPAISAVTVVLAPGDTDFTRLSFAKGAPVDWAAGGATRADSVRNALIHITQTTRAPWALVHDAARPCLAREALDRLLAAGLASDDGAILAMPLSDTLKREAAGGCIQETVDRTGLWAAQTPQLFPSERLRAALEQQLASGVAPTDEAGAMEAVGAKPLLVRGTAKNLKVTWPGDIALAEAILRQEERDA